MIILLLLHKTYINLFYLKANILRKNLLKYPKIVKLSYLFLSFWNIFNRYRNIFDSFISSFSSKNKSISLSYKQTSNSEETKGYL